MHAYVACNLLCAQAATARSASIASHGASTFACMHVQSPYQAFTFYDLDNVANYQLQKLRAAGVNGSADTSPQVMMVASEQHWSASGPQSGKHVHIEQKRIASSQLYGQL